MREPNDESGIIISWLVKLLLFLTVIGVVAFDVGSIVVNEVTLSSRAEEVAISISITVSESGTRNHSDHQIYTLAVQQVEDEADGVADTKVLRKGTEIDDAGIVHVRLRRRADTIVTKHIGPLKKYTVGIASGQAGTN